MFDNYIGLCMRHPLQCIPVFITLIPLLILIKKEAYVIAPYLILLIFLITKLAIDLAMFHLAANRINNIILYNLSLPISYTLLAGMFIYKLDSGVLKRLVATSIVAFAIFSVWDMLNVNPQLEDNHHHAMVPYASTIQCILMLLWILLYFYELMKSMKVPNLFTSTFFWICCGLLLYYSSFVFIAPVLHYTEKWDNPLSIGFAANISYLFEIFYLIMMSIGLMNFQKHNYARH